MSSAYRVSKVFVRVTPAAPGSVAPCVSTDPLSNNIILTAPPSLSAPNAMNDNNRYAAVGNLINSDVDADAVYASIGHPLLERALRESSNPLLITHGAAGSGRSFTLFGDEDHSSGLSHMMVADLYKLVEQSHPDNFSINVSFLEIIDDVINDLLNPTGRNLIIRDDTARNNEAKLSSYVDGLAWCTITGPQEFASLVEFGRSKLTFANGHQRGSAVLSIEVHINDPTSPSHDGTRPWVVSSIRLVDLAPSDKAMQPQSRGSGLAAIENVLSDISQRKKHVSYRDSKLTHLLQDSLSTDDSHLFVFLVSHIRNDQRFFNENWRTLQFVQRVSGFFGNTAMSIGGAPGAGLNYSPRKGANNNHRHQNPLNTTLNNTVVYNNPGAGLPQHPMMMQAQAPHHMMHQQVQGLPAQFMGAQNAAFRQPSQPQAPQMQQHMGAHHLPMNPTTPRAPQHQPQAQHQQLGVMNALTPRAPQLNPFLAPHQQHQHQQIPYGLQTPMQQQFPAALTPRMPQQVQQPTTPVYPGINASVLQTPGKFNTTMVQSTPYAAQNQLVTPRPVGAMGMTPGPQLMHAHVQPGQQQAQQQRFIQQPQHQAAQPFHGQHLAHHPQGPMFAPGGMPQQFRGLPGAPGPVQAARFGPAMGMQGPMRYH